MESENVRKHTLELLRTSWSCDLVFEEVPSNVSAKPATAFDGPAPVAVHESVPVTAPLKDIARDLPEARSLTSGGASVQMT